MQNRGFNPPANLVAYRTVYNEVEAIKAYLRRFRLSGIVDIDEETIRKMVEEYLSGYTSDVISDLFGDFVMSLISPLRTEYVNSAFIDYIISGVVSCDCSDEGIINVVSKNFMSIIEYNSSEFLSYIENYANVDIDAGDVINIITGNAGDIVNYISGDIYNVISDDVLELVNNNFMTIVKENHTDFISYIESWAECDITSDVIVSMISSNQEEIMKYISGTVFSYINDDIMSLISPLKTSYVNSAFIDYIISGITSCDCSEESIVNVVSKNFMSIIEYNSEAFIDYITNYVDVEVTSAVVIDIITENSDTILGLISEDIYNYISGFISECSCEDPSTDIANQVQQAIADQYPELDVKYILRDYHLIDKHCISLISTALTIPTSSLYNPASGFERFRLLALVSSDSSVVEPLTDFNQALTTDGKYQIYDPAAGEGGIAATLSSTTTGLSLLLTGFFNSHISDQSVLWYGFTDLINPYSVNPPDYTVVVSIDGSPNYLKLMDYGEAGTTATKQMTVAYAIRNAYDKRFANSVRRQFGANIEVVEVVPHPLLVNDSERYIVIRAITDSSKKGYWVYRSQGTVTDAYTYNRLYNRSVLKFSPLESPIMYASILNGTTANYYIYKLDQAFVGRSDIYSIDLSNFVPFTNELISGLTTNQSEQPPFTNINAKEQNFGFLSLSKAFQSCVNLASIDLSYIESFIRTDTGTFNETFAYCSNVQTIYCNSLIGGLLSDHFAALVTQTDYGRNAIISGRTWTYDDTLGAIVFSPQQSPT